MNMATESKPMAEPGWIIKQRARAALRNGQVDDAHRLLDELIASGNRRTFALRDEVVQGYLQRAERLLRQKDIEAAWADWLGLEQLAPDDGNALRLRESLTRLELATIRDALDAGNPLEALQFSARLKARPFTAPELAALEEAAQDWVLALNRADQGDFPLARAALERVRPRLGKQTPGLDRFEQDLARRHDRFRTVWNELQEAMAAQDWRNQIRLADEVLRVAPSHKDAQQSRNRAWHAVQAETTPYRARPENSLLASVSVADVGSTSDTDSVLSKRFILWIDGVGAWLVCLGARISIGQATPEGGPIDVPLLADVSRIHATLARDDESYVLETTRGVSVNGQPSTRAVLRTGDVLALASCQMRFSQQVPGCLTAKLTIDGGRRLPMAVDGVILMADMLVLGPGEKVHVSMPELARPMYLFRQDDRLGIHWPGEFTVEGQRCKDRALLPAQGCVSSEEFAFAIESLGR